MAKQTKTYRPSEELEELVRRYIAGDRSNETIELLRKAMATDTRFKSYFNTMTSNRTLNLGRGENWRIGTNGASVGGGEQTIPALGRSTAGASAWNHYRMNRSGYNGAPTSPGGFKASGRDEDSALRRSGLVSGDRAKAAVSFGRNGATINGQTYSKAQVDAILKRGLSGATMNWKDQAIYDALGGYGTTLDEVYANRKAEIRQEQAARRKAAEEEQRIKDTDDYNRRRLIIGRGYKLTPEQMAAIREGRATFRNGQFFTNEDLYKQGVQRTKAAADAYDAAEKSRKDALEYASKLVKAGTHEWTKSQRETMQKLQDEIDRVSSDENIKADAKARTRAELEQRLYDIRTNPHEKIVPDETNDENFTKNTRTDERGIIWAKDSNGSWKVAYNPKDYEAEDKLAQIDENRRIRAEERAEKRRLDRNKWVADKTLDQKNAHEKARLKAKELWDDKYITDEEKKAHPFSRQEWEALYDTDELRKENPFVGFDDFDEISVRNKLFDIYDATDKDGDQPSDIPVPSAGSERNQYGYDWSSASQVPLTEDELRRLDEMHVGQEVATEFARKRRDERISEEDANPVADKWAHRAMGGDANAVAPAQTEDEMLTPQSEEEFVPGGICPVCGEQLDEFGNCNVCGYPDEQAIASWKLENGIE